MHDELGPVLDSPIFFLLLKELERRACASNGLLMSDMLTEEMRIIKEKYKAALIFYLQSAIPLAALYSLQRLSIDETLAMATAKIDFKFYDGPIVSITNQSYDEAIGLLRQEMQSIILPVSRVLMSKNECKDFVDITSSLVGIKKNIEFNKERTGTLLDSTLKTIVKISQEVNKLSACLADLVDETNPVAQNYIETFCKYIEAVIESLNLKLQIVRFETRLGSYSIDKLEELQLFSYKSGPLLINHLDDAIFSIQDTLELFDKFGTSLAPLAHQYCQLLTQIELVTEDIDQLKKI